MTKSAHTDVSSNPHPLPPTFVAKMRKLLGAEATAFFASMQSPAVRGLRMRTFGESQPANVPDALRDWVSEEIPWAANAYYIDTDSPLGKHPLHEAGAYYLQEPSAMAIALAVDPQGGERILDLCAAPGGKTTAIGTLLQTRGNGQLIANEIHPNRVLALAENIERMGVRAAIVNETPQRLCASWTNQFDAILVDAPCSGEGMFRKDPDAIAAWTPNSAFTCAVRQREILACAVRMLRTGGRLIYSTCTFNPEENEQIVAWLVESFSLVVDPLPNWPGWVPGRSDWGGDQAIDLSGTRRLWPHLARGEGHFVARLRLSDSIPGDDHAPSHSRKRSRQTPRTTDTRDESRLNELLNELVHVPATAFAHLIAHGDGIYTNELAGLPQTGLRILRSGLPVATRESKDRLIPHHALAKYLDPNASRAVYRCNDEQVTQYLKGLALPNVGEHRGYIQMVYQGYGLGFAKAVPGRLNNLYPRGLRKDCTIPTKRPN